MFTPSIILSFSGTDASAFIMIIVVAICIGLIPQIFYLITLQKTMEFVSPQNRKMSPGQVWLVLIPVFGLIWNFMMIGYIADSLAGEFRMRNIPNDEDRPGYQTGLWMCILPLIGIIPIIGVIASIGGLILWIVYWVKIAGYKKQLEQANMFPPNPSIYGGFQQ